MQHSDLGKIMQLLRTPEGQQLMQYLKEDTPTARTAAAQASAGDMEAAKKTLAPLLEKPELRALLEKLGGSP